MTPFIGEIVLSFAIFIALLAILIYSINEDEKRNKIIERNSRMKRPQGIHRHRRIQITQKTILNDQKIELNRIKIESLEPDKLFEFVEIDTENEKDSEEEEDSGILLDNET